MNLLRVIKMVALEAFSADSLVREPEPSAAMDSAENVEAFDQQGLQEGPMMPLYHFNSLAISRLLPEGGRLLDLGSGSGRLLAHLATGRPDVEILGIELAQPMVDLGNRMFEREGLFPRVRLERGDMTAFGTRPFDRLDAISINLALEHLEDFSAVQTLVAHVGESARKFGCGFWLFNHTRPKTRAVAALFPEAMTPEAPPHFKADSRNSLIASWRYSELLPVLRSALGDRLHGRVSRLLPFYLAFWADPTARKGTGGLWQGPARPAGRAGQDFAMFRALLLPDVPLDTPRQRA
jgi:SAM-dependent methyltransferase